MKSRLKYVILVAIATVSLLASAQSAPRDTIYLYKSWEQMLNMDPQGMVLDPIIDAYTPYEIYIETGNDVTDKNIETDYMAVSQGDVWLINIRFLKDNFGGELKGLDGYIPIFFNEKVAFLTGNAPIKVKDIFFRDSEGEGPYSLAFYYIDFLNHQIKRVTHKYLSELLEDYHDLQMRYEGMKDYKKDYIIEDYFYQYVDRATQDFMRPYIIDLVETDDSRIN